jgi:7,8-dihydropterin-6-yl-methyl-4-(beta-D-ribofuranosyl)aminobenzene 5'-phosphate synthase
MKIISLVENTRMLQRKDLHTEPGLSLCIFTEGRQILFDTGLSNKFYSNAQRLNVDISQVGLVVISHHHFDHGGGLATFLDVNHHAKIYLKNSSTEHFYFDIFGLFRYQIGLDATLFQKYPQRFAFINQFTEIAPDIFILTKIEGRHPIPKGNRHLFMVTGNSLQLDDFEHELILVIRQDAGLVIFTECSHHGILNMLDTVVAHFPDQPIKAVFGGFHLIDLPLINTMAGSKEDVEEVGQAMLEFPIEKIYTGHCTGPKAYRILKNILGAKLENFPTGCQIEL